MNPKKLVTAALWLMLAGALPFGPAAAADAGTDKGVVVHVEKNGDAILVDVSFSVAASQQETWNVLVDFDHMSEFISNLQSSKVISRSSNKLQVTQVGKAARGMLAFSFESIREVELVPHHTIRTKLVSGSMKKMDGTTTLTPEGNGTRVDYHGESVPNVWVPPVVGLKFIEQELQEQFGEIRTEVMKRKTGEIKRLSSKGSGRSRAAARSRHG